MYHNWVTVTLNLTSDLVFRNCIESGAYLLYYLMKESQRTSDGGNGNHSVSLPIILMKIKVDLMLPSSYIS